MQFPAPHRPPPVGGVRMWHPLRSSSSAQALHLGSHELRQRGYPAGDRFKPLPRPRTRRATFAAPGAKEASRWLAGVDALRVRRQRQGVGWQPTLCPLAGGTGWTAAHCALRPHSLAAGRAINVCVRSCAVLALPGYVAAFVPRRVQFLLPACGLITRPFSPLHLCVRCTRRASCA